jgi:predicted ATPase
VLTRLRLHNFKNFRDAELTLGALSVIVGTNASGKSNIRDAFRFLHGVARGYTLAEIAGEKYIEGGILQWKGIRGGTRELAFMGAGSFRLEVDVRLSRRPFGRVLTYAIEVGVANGNLHLRHESLHDGPDVLFEAEATAPQFVKTQLKAGGRYRRGQAEQFASNRPVLTQLSERVSGRSDAAGKRIVAAIEGVERTLRSMQFLDLSPEVMRQPSLPGQSELGDRGENLASVLQAICADPAQKDALIEWVRALTPMDAVDFEFPTDLTGRTSVALVEENGRRISVYSASDGTLRFLAMIAVLLGPEPQRFYFFEELENGIHPTRLHLLLQLIEQKVKGGELQMVATTHSPQLLQMLSKDSLAHASLIYRLESSADAGIRRILDIPDAATVLQSHDIANLHSSGWMEDIMAFAQEE